jgi:NAD-dependent dihydropyrimidine dehydrogenase PreA subunit
MKILTHAQMVSWLDNLARERPLIASNEVSGVLLYRPVESSDEITWGSTRPVMSIKEVFFPPTERLLTIEKDGQQVRLTEVYSNEKPVVFGVRPCDARGMQVLDALFINTSPIDPYYSRRRENTVMVGLACQEMGPSCFCTSVGGAPDDISGLDILVTEVGEDYVIQVITEKGETLLKGLTLADFLGELPQPQLNPPLELVEKEAWPAHFNDEYWERNFERCLSCRICAYVCPTCRCFSVRDEALPAAGQYERIRCWDSCAGENYRRIAGGHRPRAEKGERLRNRFECKFYYYPEQYGLDETVACTGCGRCVDACPVNIDITEVLTELAR